MPEDEKEKAENLASANKRYEQIKKYKGKKPAAETRASDTTAPDSEDKAKDGDFAAGARRIVEKPPAFSAEHYERRRR